MEKDYPFLTDYAKSGRSNCKNCRNTIKKDSLRLAVFVQSPIFDGKMTNWYHFDCFFKTKSKVNSIEDIKNIDSLRWEDQERIKNNIKISVKDIAFSNYGVEYTKQKTAKCAKCLLVMEKGTLRMSCKESEKEKLSGVLWHHVDCFHAMKDGILIKTPDFDLDNIVGFDKLKEVDQQELIEKFKNWKSKKRTASISNEEVVTKKSFKKELTLDDELKSQNDFIWKTRDRLEKLPKSVLVALLEHNEQYVPPGDSNLRDVLSDRMVFGCINHCPECGGQLSYSSNQYQCKSNVNEWTKCLYETKEVERSEFKIPSEYCEYGAMIDYCYVERQRVLTDATAIISTNPLKGYSFVIDYGKYGGGYSQTKISKRIKDLGGVVTRQSCGVSDVHAAVISNGSAKDKPESFIACAKLYNIDVVTPNFLDNLETEDLMEALRKYRCVDWGRSKEELRNLKRVGQSVKENVNGASNKIQTLSMKGGAVVDPDSGMECIVHIYRDTTTNDHFNAILGMVDLVRGSNSFYKLQLLESDTNDGWWVFRSWGRIGTTIGGNKCESFDDLHDAMDSFLTVYLDKTGNEWCNRHKFQKQPQRFYPMDVDYGDELSTQQVSMVETESTLSESVQRLIKFIFDIASMKKAMTEFEIDLRKMPLGKLSKKQIQLSYNVLNELQQLLMNSETPLKSKLLDASTRFYTLLPHDFGMRAPPLLDSLDVIKTKCEMIDNLLEIEIAMNIMNEGGGENQIDKCYEQLHNRINVLKRNSETFRRIDTYLHNTHADTHNNYRMEIIEIFDLARDNEDERFSDFRQLPNRMMLWHGSRRTNWAGILSQGLRIAPPEAPVSGYMFGKGIYFADMVSKSANYCATSASEPEGLLLLCEVALGNITERKGADQDIKLRVGEHSCKGIGGTVPDPGCDYVDDDGVVYPMGTPMTRTDHRGSLLYNEYIVYDVGQVRQRYLIRVKFNYDSRR